MDFSKTENLQVHPICKIYRYKPVQKSCQNCPECLVTQKSQNPASWYPRTADVPRLTWICLPAPGTNLFVPLSTNSKAEEGLNQPPLFLPGSKSTPCCNWMLTQKHLLPRRKNFFYQFDKVDDKLIYKVQTGAKHCNSTKQARRNKNIQKSMFLE